jgi:hypothetical protein
MPTHLSSHTSQYTLYFHPIYIYIVGPAESVLKLEKSCDKILHNIIRDKIDLVLASRRPSELGRDLPARSPVYVLIQSDTHSTM